MTPLEPASLLDADSAVQVSPSNSSVDKNTPLLCISVFMIHYAQPQIHMFITYKCTTTTQQHNNTFNGPLSRSTQVSRYQNKHSLTHTVSLWLIYNNFLRPTASSMHICQVWQCFSVTPSFLWLSLGLHLPLQNPCTFHPIILILS